MLAPQTPLLQRLRSAEARWLAFYFALLVGFAVALRLYGLDRWSLWLDETVQYSYTSKPLSELYAAMDAYGMPISLELGRALVWLGFDHTAGQLRLPSAILGVATIVIVFFLAKELLGRRTAWFSALVACVMPVLVVYSQEYRNYSPLIFLMVLSGWSLAVALRTNHPAWWCLFVGSTILNLYTHFVALSGFAALGVFAIACILLKLRQSEPVKTILASSIMAFGIIGIAYLPALPMLARLSQVDHADMPGPGPSYGELFRLIYVQYPGFDGSVGLIAAGLAILGILWAGFRSPRALLFLVATLGVSALLFHGHSRVAFSPRYVSFMMPSFAVAIGAGLAAISFAGEAVAARRWPQARHAGAIATAVLMILLVLASVRPLSNVYAANPKQLPVDLREGFNYVRNRIQPNDLLLEASTQRGGSVYWFGSYESYFMRDAIWPTPPAKGIIDDLNFPNGFTRYLNLPGRLWVLITVGDEQRSSVQARNGAEFAVRCFRQICAIRSRNPLRSMLQQLNAFFDRFADLDPKYFAASARAVRQQIDVTAEPR